MPRSSRSGGGRPAPSGARGSHTMAAPRQQQHQQQQHAPYAQQQHAPAAAQQQQGRSPGLFGQMASTAAGVAVGSTVGHGLSNMFFGGGGEVQQPPPAQGDYAAPQQNAQGGLTCEVQSKDFLRCLDSTNNNMDSCAYYLDQLKACQAAARPY